MYSSTPFSQGLADNTVISKVNNVLWDLERPLEGDCKLQLLKFDDEEAQQVFWHSTAHVLGEAMERIYGGCLCYGPPIENGFYYDMFMDDKQVSNTDFPCIEGLMKKIVKEKQPFERLEMKKEDLLEMFKVCETFYFILFLLPCISKFNAITKGTPITHLLYHQILITCEF